MRSQEQPELGAVDRLRDVGPAHVIDDHGRGQRGEEVPAARAGRAPRSRRRRASRAAGSGGRSRPARRCGVKSTRRLRKLKRTPRTPASCSSLELARRVTLRRTVATPRARAAAGAAGIDHRAVVGAVAGGLHDDVAREAEVIAQREQLRLAGVAGRVLSLGRVGELRARAEHVAVRVHRAGRRREAAACSGCGYQSSQPGVFSNGSSSCQPRLRRLDVVEDPVGLDAPVGAAARSSCVGAARRTRPRRRGRPPRPGARRCRPRSTARGRPRAR